MNLLNQTPLNPKISFANRIQKKQKEHTNTLIIFTYHISSTEVKIFFGHKMKSEPIKIEKLKLFENDTFEALQKYLLLWNIEPGYQDFSIGQVVLFYDDCFLIQMNEIQKITKVEILIKGGFHEKGSIQKD